jgi:hypothetical protein
MMEKARLPEFRRACFLCVGLHEIGVMLFMHDLNSRGEDLAIEEKRVYN